MKVDAFNCLERQQNPPGDPGSVGDSCFDTCDVYRMDLYVKSPSVPRLSIDHFIDHDNKLQRHPRTAWPNTISSDQAHMFILSSKGLAIRDIAVNQIIQNGFRTSNGNLVSVALYAEIMEWQWLTNLSLIVQIILFWIPVRWNDGGGSKIQFGYRHHCGDYRLFKQVLFGAPWIIRRLVLRSTLRKMTRYYWEPEPNSQWLIELEDKFVEEL